MKYIHSEANGQLFFETETNEYLQIPSYLNGFRNEETTIETAQSGRTVLCFRGSLSIEEEDRVCKCGRRMHINAHQNITLRHLCFGGNLSCVFFPHNQFKCPDCGATKSQFISFKAPGHRITRELYQYTRDLLAMETYTNKQVAEITGLGKNVVKAIDKKRLQERYTMDGKEIIKPEKTTKILGIDEFKLHNGRKYATHIIDMETGHILWIVNGKKKQVVYDFINHVGLEWMDSVEAVACDMNSDFQEAFEERCPHIQPVFDHFHLIKNFNDKVVSEVRKDEQRRLYDEGNIEAAKALKKTRYILMSKRSTLQKKDRDAEAGRIIHRGSTLFGTPDVIRKAGYEDKYDSLLKENALLFTLDLIKAKLDEAYKDTVEARMAEKNIDIMDICEATGNPHLLWFRKLLDNHFEGIIAHATFQITSGKVEGINQKIKTLRQHGYGYPDDEYFFLKLFDASRRSYVRNPKSHRICD
ncbi:MAG: ISL3 family transposase [Eubacteriaceae bacterium]|nr:ISL3 family transposase [Eubacteriaceae bacterium]